MPDSMFRRGIRLFLHPSSPAACYRNPYPLFAAIVARSVNLMLRALDRLLPTDTVTCAVCGWSGSRFGYSSAASVNALHRNDICLGCGANTRTRRMIEILTEVADLDTHLVVADVGPAPATREFFRDRDSVKYVTIDLYKDSDIRSSITAIALAEGVVDVVMCCHVLEHIDDDQRGIGQLYRILKPGGFAIIVVPQRHGLAQTKRITEATFDGYGHKWLYGDDFPKRVQHTGFTLISSRPCEGSDPIHVFEK